MTAPTTTAPAERGGGHLGGLVSAGGRYVAVAAAQSAGSLVLVPLAAAVLAPAELGVVAAAMATAQLVRAVAAAGLPGGLTIVYFNRTSADGTFDHDRSRSLLTAAAVLTAAVGLVLVTALALVAVVGGGAIGTALVLGAVIGAGQAVAQQLQAWTRCVERIGLFAVATLATGPGAQGLALVVLLVVGGGTTVYVAGWSAAAVASAAAALLFAPPRSPRSLPGGAMSDALRVGAPTIVHTLGTVLLSVGDRYVIEWTLGSEAVGRYHLAYLLGSGGIVVAAAASSAWAPFVLRHEPADRGAAIERSSVPFLALAVAVGAVAALLTPIVIAVVTPASYEPTSIRTVAGVIGATALPFAVYLGAQISLLGTERTGVVATATVVAATVNLGLNAALIGWVGLGLDGAALATVVSYALLAALSSAGARRSDPAFRVDRPTLSFGVATLAIVVAVAAVTPVAGAGAVVRVALAVAVAAGSAAVLRRSLGR